MLVTSDDGSERNSTSDFTDTTISPEGYLEMGIQDARDEVVSAPPQHHFARVYAQDDEAIEKNYYAESTSDSSPWLKIQRWFLVNTFMPQWLPQLLRHAFVGYVIALLLQIVMSILTVVLIHMFPTFAFTSLLEILVVAFVALNFGTGPSLLATLAGLVLLDFFVLSAESFMSSSSTGIQYLIENLLFLIVGVTISVTASQVERARRSAFAERTLFDAVIETVPDSVSVYDAKGRLVRLNSAGRQLEKEQGYEPITRSHSTGKLQTLDGKVLQHEQLPITRALRGETVSGMEMLWRDDEKQTHYLSVSAAPLFNAWHHLNGVVAISHDVTALRRSQQQMAESTGELDAVFESIADGVFIFNRQSSIFRMNAAFRHLVGISTRQDYFSYSLEERRNFFQLLSDRGEPLPLEQWPQNRILAGETLKGATAIDMQLHTIDGRDVFLSISGAPIYAQDGTLVGGVAICRDITERRRLERYTQTTLNGLLAMAQTLVEGMGVERANEDETASSLEQGAISAVEQRMATLTSEVMQCKRVGIIAVETRTRRLLPVAVHGLTPAQERLWWEHVPQMRPETAPDILPLLQRLQKGEVISIDVAQVPGAYLYTLFSSRSILLAPMVLRDVFMGFLILDNAEEEHIYTSEEQVLAGTVAKLAALIIERERLLRERAEARANEIALREANQRMNEFLGIASHELKTPMTTIKGSVQLLERRIKRILTPTNMSAEESTRVQKETEDLLRRTSTQVSRLTRLIDDLLDVSRIQENRLRPNLEPCDLAAIVKDVVHVQRQNVPARTITLTLPAASSIPVLADIGRIEQVLTNYLSNALKYSAAETPVNVAVELHGRMAWVAVHDEGVGISQEEQMHVWERFYRVPNIEVQSGSGVGLGLGLYICKTIIELHQGEVGVQSETGKGSTFWFTLPLLGES